jgi:hypothetical protein
MHPSTRSGPRTRALLLAMALGIAGLAPLAGGAQAADTIQTIATSYQPTIAESIDASGFKHPGIGLTKDVLENLRTQVRAQKEPWNTYFNQMLLSSAASRTFASSNISASDPSRPGVVAFNSQSVESRFIADALRAYTQAILYYVTGDEVYRANAMRLIRLWSQMDPAQYAYYSDAHIHTGIPLNRMVAAAEILRYTSCQTAALAWTDEDTAALTTNLITPVIEKFQHKNTYFMNQHLYPLIGAMSGYIFTGNRARYDEGVEWFTVNKTAVDQGQNGAIKPLFRLVTKDDSTGQAVTPVVQHVEMGRDQAHGAGDLTNASLLARLLMSQGTKVDPVDGTSSTAPNAVGPYEFLNDRILDATEYFARFMMGYDTPWVPTAAHTDASGNPTIVYKSLANAYRGRLTQNTWEQFYYYKYARGENIEARAPSFTKMFSERTLYNWDGVDGGGDFWIFIPPAAEAEGTRYLVRPIVDPVREIEDRFTALDDYASAQQDTTASYVRVLATAAGSRIVLTGYANSTTNVAFRVRTNGPATLDVFGDTIVVPDTKGQWRYVDYAFNAYQFLGDFVPITVKGAGTTVDLDHLNLAAGTSMTPPVFNTGNASLSLYSNAGSTAALSYSFAATDATAADVLTYQVDNLPPGAAFDTRTGAFAWTPAQAGTYTFVVTASDGGVVTSRTVKIVVSADRQSAVAAAAAGFKQGTTYTRDSLAAYNTAYASASAAVAAATDAEFGQKLAALGAATDALREVTPLLADGSMNYANMFAASTFGTAVPYALDGLPDTFVPYTQAANVTHTFDFGPGFKLAATSFQLQVRASFPERIGGVAMFGSNDNLNWTRLTPGLTTVTEDMQTLAVSADLQAQRFRFLKMQMVQPSSSLLELSEFRIYGTRYETINQLASVSIASPQGLRNRTLAGSTVKLTSQSTAPINNDNVRIRGVAAQVTTTDNLNWTATTVLAADAAPGAIGFSVDYKTADGLDGDTVLSTTDGTSLYVSDQTGALGNLLGITTLQDSNGRTTSDLQTVANGLFDSNLTTFTDFRLNGSGSGGYLIFDFKEGGLATLARAEIVPRQDQYYTRIAGTVLQGSNDNATWTTISNSAQSTADWQTLTMKSTTGYRYVRVYNGGAWYGNMAELRLYGSVESTNRIATASVGSAQALRNRVVAGNTVKLTFAAKEAVSNVSVTIQGQSATVTTTDNVNFTAQATLNPGVAAGALKFAVNYTTQSGKAGLAATATTDGSSLYVADEADVIRNVTSIATLIDSTVGRTAAATLTQTNYLFDANMATNSDYRTGTTNSGSAAWIVFDFKSGNQVNLASVELAARQDTNYTRAAGTVVQGSNDNTSWTTLTPAAVSTLDWQQLPVASPTPYRYIRIYNPGAWFGNLAEVRLHGSVHAADVTPPTTTASAPQGWVNGNATVALSATDAVTAVTATYYKIDGGAQQTGTAAVVSAEGTHTVSYWSVDAAGNVEQPHSVSVKIDKTAPATAATTTPAAPASGWYLADVAINLAPTDAASGVAATWYTVDGGAPQSGTSLALSAKGAHTLAYWSLDAAGNVEAARTLSVNIGPIDASAGAQMTQQGATLNRATGKYVGGVTITNKGAAPLAGPLWLALNGLTAGVTLDNASGATGGAPYVALAGPLAAGASVTVSLTFTNPARALVTYTPALLKPAP